jgi:hypothetical protein
MVDVNTASIIFPGFGVLLVVECRLSVPTIPDIILAQAFNDGCND